MRSPFRAPASTRRGARWSRCEPYVARPTEKRNSSDVAHDLVGALLNMGDGETYRIVTCASIMGGSELAPVSVAPVFDTGCAFPTFGIVKPALCTPFTMRSLPHVRQD